MKSPSLLSLLSLLGWNQSVEATLQACALLRQVAVGRSERWSERSLRAVAAANLLHLLCLLPWGYPPAVAHPALLHPPWPLPHGTPMPQALVALEAACPEQD